MHALHKFREGSLMLSSEHQTQLDAIESEIAKLLEVGSNTQAVERLTLILGSMGELDDYKTLRGALLARRADLKLEDDDEEGAWEDAQKAMNLGWYDAAVHAIGGWAMLHMEQPKIALEQFTKSIELNPERARSYVGRALTHLEDDEYDLAREDLSRAIQIDAEDDTAWGIRAEVGLYLGTAEAALRDIERARKLAPEDADYALLHARLALVRGDFETAKAALNHALKDEDAALEALCLRSHLRLQGGDLKGARADAIRATNAYPDEAFAFVSLASIQLAEDNGALALRAADRAVTLDPTLPDAYLVRAAAHNLVGDKEAQKTDEDRVADEAPELHQFLLGPVADYVDPAAFFPPAPEVPKTKAGAATPAMPGLDPASFGIPGLGGMNPAAMLDQVFDADGNIKPAFKPIMKMALKNAPSLLKTMPPSMLESRGIDPKMLDGVDLDNIDEEQLEAQMKLFYKMMKSQS